MEKHDMMAISTKVSPEAYAAIKHICENKLNCTIYDAMQMFVDVLIRYTDESHNLSEKLNAMIRLFEGMKDWDKHINLCEPMDRVMISEAIYILREDGKVGSRMCMADGAHNSLFRTVTFNYRDIFNRFITRFNPHLKAEMDRVMPELECNDYVELIMKLLDLYRENPDDKAIRDMFENNDYVYAQHQHDERNRQKRTMINSMDAYERRQTSLTFNNENNE